MEPFRSLSPKSKYARLERFPMSCGIDPPRLLLLRFKRVRVDNEMKSNSASVPVRLASARFISETVRALWQTMAVQLQRLLRLVSDHESRGEGERLFFHLIRASACVLGDDVIFHGRKESKRI